jgi:Domain of unknown function (DUF1772)
VTIDLNAVIVMVALLSAGVIYGTDMFFAAIGRSALGRSSDTAMTEVMGRLHEIGDARMPIFGAIALTATLALIFTSGVGSLSSFLAIGAIIGLGTQLATYLGVAQPINKAQSAAARQGVTPSNARELQRRWDSVIVLRAVGMLIAMICLIACVMSLGG